MYKLVLVRHGESEWNKMNLFTGWTDVDLSDNGINEAKSAGEILKKDKYHFDIVFTSYLRRAIHTMNYVLDILHADYLPIRKSWRLNERHYGALQGLNKSETAAKFGKEQVQIWRRSFDVRPPEFNDAEFEKFYQDERYNALSIEEKPRAESLKDTIARAAPYFEKEIKPYILAGKDVLIVAHGNSIRALVKYFDNLSDEEIVGVNIPTGVPLVYELNAEMKAEKSYYLGDQEAIKRKQEAVKNQVK